MMNQLKQIAQMTMPILSKYQLMKLGVILLIIENVVVVMYLTKNNRQHGFRRHTTSSPNDTHHATNLTENNVTETEGLIQNTSILYGCRSTAQTLLFCAALKEAKISFIEKEVKLDREILFVTFRNKNFPIIIPLHFMRACYKLKPEKILRCQMLSSNVEKSSKFSNRKEQYYLQVIYFVLMNILPERGKTFSAGQYFPYFRFEDSNASDNVVELELWHQDNLDNLIEHHTLNINDVMDLKGKLMTSFGDMLTNQDTRPVHIFAYVDTKFPLGNVGDTLGPYITAKLTNKSVNICMPDTNLRNTSQHLHLLAATGSILPIVPRNGIIWSSGYLSDKIKASPSNLYLTVRGPASRLMLILQNEYLQWTPQVSGDSAFLLPLLYYPQNFTKKYELCVVLHFIDDKMKIFLSKKITLVSFKNTAEDFVDQILTCKNVLSSSLHGLIIAHSYGIPAIGIKVSENVEGADFKFSDHYRSLGIYLATYRKSLRLQSLNLDPEYYVNLVRNTPQPTRAKMKDLQRKLLKTFPLKIVKDPMNSNVKFNIF